MRASFSIWSVSFATLFILAVSNAQAAALRLGHEYPVGSPYHQGAQRFVELVRAKTNGRLVIDIYGESMIDNEAGLARRISQGSLDMAVLTAGNLTRYNPDFLIFELPYLFEDYAHADRVLTSEVGKNLAERLEKQGLKVLSYWESGFRHYSNNVHPVREPEDLMHLTIATPNWPGSIEAADATGGISRPMPIPHFYDALQNKEVDGVEAPVFAMRTSHYYQWQTFLTLDGHTYMPAALVINPRRFKNMSAEFRAAITKAAEEAGFYQRRLVRDQVEENLQFLMGPGDMQIFHIEDKGPWIEASKRVYETLASRVNNKLVAKVRSLATSSLPPAPGSVQTTGGQAE